MVMQLPPPSWSHDHFGHKCALSSNARDTRHESDHLVRHTVSNFSVDKLCYRSGNSVWASNHGNREEESLLSQAFERLLESIGHRIAAFDHGAAVQAANLMASRQRKGRPVELRDTMIAGIVLARHASLATRNVAHFEDLTVPVLNPWTA